MQPLDSQNNIPEAPYSPPAGVPSQSPMQQNMSVQPSDSTNGLAIAGLVTAFFFPLVGLVLSIIGLSQAKKRNQKGAGLAIAGIALSALFMLFGLLFFILVILGGQQAAKDAERAANTNSNLGITDRADSQASDIEAKVGEAATIDDVQMTITNPKYVASLGEFDKAKSGQTYVVADVALENKGSETRSFNAFDFRIQTAGGQVLDTGFASVDKPLNYGDLVAGGKTSGQIVFEIPVATGSEFIIWKPSGLDSTRVLVKIK